MSASDITHAVRSAIRQVLLDEDLTMLIGPAQDGALLEAGVAMLLRPKFRRFLT